VRSAKRLLINASFALGFFQAQFCFVVGFSKNSKPYAVFLNEGWVFLSSLSLAI